MWRSLLLNDDGTYGIFTWDGPPVPSSWATAYLSATGKAQRFWLQHAFVNRGTFVYDIRVQNHGRLDRLEHGTCTRITVSL
jgi:hypothetical protein